LRGWMSEGRASWRGLVKSEGRGPSRGCVKSEGRGAWRREALCEE
jgi:hypothetical protein